MYFSIAFYEYNFFNITLRFCIFAYLFNLVFVYIFCCNTPIYREILLQFTEKYYINRTLFHFRHCAEAVLKRAARLSKVFSTARPSTPTERFYTLIWTLLDEKVLARFSKAWRLKQAIMFLLFQVSLIQQSPNLRRFKVC